jgi:hypothetical protein
LPASIERVQPLTKAGGQASIGISAFRLFLERVMNFSPVSNVV